MRLREQVKKLEEDKELLKKQLKSKERFGCLILVSSAAMYLDVQADSTAEYRSFTNDAFRLGEPNRYPFQKDLPVKLQLY
jgi:Tfp pilus assembly protein PilO